ncbi:PKD domain-containing protein, partial [Paraconexibacter sp.]|uniref:PKD domain-containing protein n=1 Tax=Paraconexibacter sp. TaxID=2949640 RepID=UPI00356414A4
MSRIRLSVAAVSLLTLALTQPAAAQQPTTTRASLSSTGTPGNEDTFDATVSANGRFVAFNSFANNLAGSDTNGVADVFLRDRHTGATSRVNVGPSGAQANAEALFPEMSADGRLVLFRSSATNLVPGSPPGPQLFLADTTTGAVRLAATVPATHALSSSTDSTVLSRDGSRVVFRASRTSGGIGDVFAADTGTGAVRRVTETAAGAAANGTSFDLAVSGDGRWVAFTTEATNLATPDTNGFRDIVVADLQSGSFQRASVPSGPPTNQPNLHSSQPSLSFDGCLIAFRSDASNLVAPDPGPGVTEVFARNRCTSETEVVSVNNAGTAGTAYEPSVSDDGCLVAYRSANVSPAPAAGLAAVLRDRCGGSTTRLDLSSAGEPSTTGVDQVRLSGGTGRFAAFSSNATNLVPGDSAIYDAYVRDRAINTRPIAELVVGQSGRSVTADARASRDLDGPAVTGSIAWGDGSPDSPGLLATHDYARGGSYAVTVTVTDVDGATSTRTIAVTVPDTAGPPPEPPSAGGGGQAPVPGPPLPGSGQSPGPLGAPVLDRLALTKKRFAVVPRGRRVGGSLGSTLSLRLSEPATVRITFQRARTGRRVGGRCLPRARKGARCTRYTTVATLSRAARGGTSTVPITGR